MNIDKRIMNQEADELFEAILTLKNKEECYGLFIDLCTISEIQSLSQRFQVAKLLMGKVTYNEIVTKTGASTATISRVKKCLEYGTGGYEQVLTKKEKE